MIVTYLDSSALVRLCVGEGDLEPVEEAMAGLPVTSVVASVEVPGAIHARFHRGQIDAEDREALLALASRILDSIGLVGFTAAVRRESLNIAGHHLLRALDAIHLGTAIVVGRQQRRRGNALRFCSADRKQSDAAAASLGAKSLIMLPPLAAK